MTTLDKSIGRNNVIVVSHADDEVLFGAGLPLRYGDRKWTIICCSRPDKNIAPEREKEFPEVCKVLGAEPVMHKYRENLNAPLDGLNEIKLHEFDCIVTHNAYGEYGHMHHAQVHRYVVSNYSDQNIVLFGHRPGGEGKIKLSLSTVETGLKMAALQCYKGTREYGGKVLPQSRILEMQFYDNGVLKMNEETYDVN